MRDFVLRKENKMSQPKYNYCVYWWSLVRDDEGFKEVRTKKEADVMIRRLKQMGYSSRIHRGIVPKF